MIPLIGFMISALMPPEAFISRMLAAPFSFVAQLGHYELLIASCVIIAATGLLWWRCERKFRDFEPFRFPGV
jgi:hypothetical protein